MNMYRVHPEFSFIAAKPIREKRLVEEGSILYDRYGEYSSTGKDTYKEVVVGHENYVKVTAQVAFWGGDRQSPPHVSLEKVEIEEIDSTGEAPDLATVMLTTSEIKTMCHASLSLPKIGDKNQTEIANLWNFSQWL